MRREAGALDQSWLLSEAAQEACVREMANCVARTFSPRRVLLFGSRARGDHMPDSDVDLLVEFDDVGDEHELAVDIRQALSRMPLPKDVVVVAHDDFEARAESLCDIVSYAVDDARVLYERSE